MTNIEEDLYIPIEEWDEKLNRLVEINLKAGDYRTMLTCIHEWYKTKRLQEIQDKDDTISQMKADCQSVVNQLQNKDPQHINKVINFINFYLLGKGE